MNNSTLFPQLGSKSAVHQEKWKFYLLLGLVVNVIIWSLALLYLRIKAPSYTSEFTITLPGSGSSTNVNLPGIGQASSNSESAYNNTARDPRENYKFLAQSEPVLEATANQLNIPLKSLDKPRVQIVNNTTLMRFELKGDSPQEAQRKAIALYQALEVKLDELRNQEVAQQDVGLQLALNSSQKKLKDAQKRLSEYVARSGLSSSEQITNLTGNIELLRRQRAEVVAQQQQAAARLAQLSNNLNINAQEASDAFALQTDSLFQKYLQEYSNANAALISLSGKFLPSHPAVIEERVKRDAAQSAILNRSQVLLGRPISQATLAQLRPGSLNSSTSGRDNLAEQLVTVQAEQRGLQAQAQTLDQQISLLEARLKTLAQQGSTLEDLRRDVQTAEAVFSSTLARLDLGKSNIFASYPQIQLLTPPSLADTPSAPKKKFVLLGAALGSLFCTNGIVLLWLHQRKSRKPKRLESIAQEDTLLRSDSKSELLDSRQKSK